MQNIESDLAKFIGDIFLAPPRPANSICLSFDLEGATPFDLLVMMFRAGSNLCFRSRPFHDLTEADFDALKVYFLSFGVRLYVTIFENSPEEPSIISPIDGAKPDSPNLSDFEYRIWQEGKLYIVSFDLAIS